MHWMFVDDPSAIGGDQVTHIGAVEEGGCVRLRREKVDPESSVKAREYIGVVRSLLHSEIRASDLKRDGGRALEGHFRRRRKVIVNDKAVRTRGRRCVEHKIEGIGSGGQPTKKDGPCRVRALQCNHDVGGPCGLRIWVECKKRV